MNGTWVDTSATRTVDSRAAAIASNRGDWLQRNRLHMRLFYNIQEWNLESNGCDVDETTVLLLHLCQCNKEM
jgi:hypothetical protein